MATNKRGSWRKILLKALYVQLCFLVLHYLYRFIPNPVTEIFSGVNESVFQHMKIGFFSYGLVSLIEYFLNRKKVADPGHYGFSLLGASLFFCWPMLILFFSPPAYFGKYPTDLLEIISANIVLYTSSIFAILTERQFSAAPLSKEFKVMVVLLCVILISLFVIYTYRFPWFDLFAIPPGWE